MATDGKWIDGLTADMPITVAARRVFAARFQAVGRTWADALQPTNDPEVVHDLRVATRRAAAALRAFGDLLRPKDGRQLTKGLRKLRRAAGDARDNDVFLIHLQGWAVSRGDHEQPGLDWLAGLASHRRAHAMELLRHTSRLRRKWDRLVLRARPVEKGISETLAQRAIFETRRRLSAFQSAAEADLSSPANLHQLRIAGKRLRYTLELFIDGLHDEVRTQLYPEIEAVQDILGAAQDAHTIADRLSGDLTTLDSLAERLRERCRDGIMAWRNHQESEVAAGPVRFHAWYENWQRVIATAHVGLESRI